MNQGQGREPGSGVVVRDRRRGKYFQVDNVIVDAYGREMGSAALALYMVLCRRANNDESSCHVTLRRLGEDAGLGERTLKKWLRVLQEYGLVAVVPVFGKLGQHANEYVILEPPKTPKRRPLQKLHGGSISEPGPGTKPVPGPGTKNAPHKKNRVKEELLQDEESVLSSAEVTAVIRRMRDLRNDTGLSIAQLLDGGHVDPVKWSAACATSIGRVMAREIK